MAADELRFAELSSSSPVPAEELDSDNHDHHDTDRTGRRQPRTGC
ncbi:hypothetical protein ACVV2G_08275 [Streptomyces ziwulingensis]